MPLSTAVLKTGATLSTTGGSDITWASSGIQNGRNELYVAADTDLRTRREASCTVSVPKPKSDAPGGYTQARASVQFKYPKILANGNRTVNTVTITVAYDPETSAADVLVMQNVAAQALFDADFAGLFGALSLA